MVCGYTRAEGVRPATEKPPPKPTPGNALLEAIRTVPSWVWVLVGGCLVILVGCILASLSLSADGEDRALFTTALLALAVAGMVVAEAWVVPMIALDAHHLGVFDFLMPYRLWAFAIERLPRTRRPVSLLSWCVTAALGGLLIVGGLWYWLPGRPREKFRLSGPVAKVRPRDDAKPSGEVVTPKGVAEAGKDQAEEPDDSPKTEGADKPTTIRCVVLGYVPDEDGKLVSLVLGVEEKKGQIRYAGLVRRGISGANAEQLRGRLSQHVRLKPAIPGLDFQAIWVEPRVYCEVTETAVGAAETLPNPLFKFLVDPKEKK